MLDRETHVNEQSRKVCAERKDSELMGRIFCSGLLVEENTDIATMLCRNTVMQDTVIVIFFF